MPRTHTGRKPGRSRKSKTAPAVTDESFAVLRAENVALQTALDNATRSVAASNPAAQAIQERLAAVNENLHDDCLMTARDLLDMAMVLKESPNAQDLPVYEVCVHLKDVAAMATRRKILVELLKPDGKKVEM